MAREAETRPKPPQQQGSGPKPKKPKKKGGGIAIAGPSVVLVAVSAVALGVLYSRRADRTPKGDAHTLLRSLRDGTQCSSSATLPVLDVRLLGADDDPAVLRGLRCPVVLIGALELCGAARSITERWVADGWRHMRRAIESTTVQFNANSHSPSFTNWDNQTALAVAVRSRAVASQGFVKTAAAGGAFLEEVRRVGDRAALGWVRYGSTLRGFSPKLCRELRLPQCSNERSTHPSSGHGAGLLAPVSVASPTEATNVGLWVAAAGVTSTAHYDRWDNTHVVVAGRKRLLVAPPSLSAFARLGIRPGSHPHARQTRTAPRAVKSSSNATPGATSEAVPSLSADPADGVSAIEVTLAAGEAIFLPAGWLHEVTAVEPSAALSVTTIPFELGDFSQFVGDQAAFAPFLERWDDFQPERLVAALQIFLPKLLAELRVDPAALRDAILSAYGEETRREGGLPPRAGSAGVKGSTLCESAGGWQQSAHAERDALISDAVRVASRLRTYRPELLDHYMLLYMDLLLSKAGGAGDASEVLGRMLTDLIDGDPCQLFVQQ